MPRQIVAKCAIVKGETWHSGMAKNGKKHKKQQKKESKVGNYDIIFMTPLWS